MLPSSFATMAVTGRLSLVVLFSSVLDIFVTAVPGLPK
jgi:hypothetical protein